MTQNKEFVISLTRLSLPSSVNIKKLTLSIIAGSQEHFIQSEKAIKGHKINFYREHILISEPVSNITFNIYQINDAQEKGFLKKFIIEKHELNSITKRISAFKTISEGYELVWESWIFSENSSDLNLESDQDYSELDLPFENMDDQTVSNALLSSRSPSIRAVSQLKTISKFIKRSSSTDHSHSNKSSDSKNLQESLKKLGQGEKILHQTKQVKRKTAVTSCVDKKAKKNIKSHVYSSLMKGLSGFFYSSQ